MEISTQKKEKERVIHICCKLGKTRMTKYVNNLQVPVKIRCLMYNYFKYENG
uniref:Uncharacterized protein n=1 Tax=Solanum tuberosum TaxID=4113 RepID=M1D6U8_SOLTU